MSMMQSEMEPREGKEKEVVSPTFLYNASLQGLNEEAKNLPAVVEAQSTVYAALSPALPAPVPKSYNDILEEIQMTIQTGAAKDDRLWSSTAIILITLAVLLVLLGPFLVFFTGSVIFGTASVASGAFIAVISKLVLPSRTETKERADEVSDKIDRNKRLDAIQGLIANTTGVEQQRLIDMYLQILNPPQAPAKNKAKKVQKPKNPKLLPD